MFEDEGNLNAPHGRVQQAGGGVSLTKQSDALHSDVNSIVARHVAHRVPLPSGEHYSYGDFSDFDSFHDAANRVKAAEDSFAKLPANVRKHCNNDPGEYLRLVYDPARRVELEELGMVPVQAPQDAPAAAKPDVPAVVAGEPGSAPGGAVSTS